MIVFISPDEFNTHIAEADKLAVAIDNLISLATKNSIRERKIANVFKYTCDLAPYRKIVKLQNRLNKLESVHLYYKHFASNDQEHVDKAISYLDYLKDHLDRLRRFFSLVDNELDKDYWEKAIGRNKS